MLLVLLAVFLCYQAAHSAKLPSDFPDLPFYTNYDILWGGDHVRSMNNSMEVQLVLDKGSSGGGIVSKNTYLFGFMSMRIKLVANDSAGTVATFYMSSDSDPSSDTHDELDFELLGNRIGQPYIVQTNIFGDGVGNKEERITLWFDPTLDFHAYSILWNRNVIIFYVDDYPIRVFDASGVLFLKSRPMKAYATLWNGEAWATRGGLDKINWDFAPFIASYRGFNIDGCQNTVQNCTTLIGDWQYQDIDFEKLNWVRHNYMNYNYCAHKEKLSSFSAGCGEEFFAMHSGNPVP